MLSEAWSCGIDRLEARGVRKALATVVVLVVAVTLLNVAGPRHLAYAAPPPGAGGGNGNGNGGGNGGGGGGSSTAVKIMALGDSITEGGGGVPTYRKWLWETMVASGCDVDFVGSQRGWTGKNKFDADHEGYSGWRADQILSGSDGWNVYVPDVVLLHVGTNDMLQSQDIPSTINEIAQIVGNIQAANPDATVLLAQIIGVDSTVNPAASIRVQELSSAIGDLSLSTPTSSVVIVDQRTGFSPATQTSDGIHPNSQGEQQMATVWWTTLEPILGTMCQ